MRINALNNGGCRKRDTQQYLRSVTGPTIVTYDGDNNLTSETAVMPSGETSETTDYLYGVSTTTGSAIDDNDLLYQVQYPDPTTGEASADEAETYSYDALGDTLTYTDRNGTTHAYSYDALDRLTADSITQFGSGVDQTVAKIGFSYNDAGLLADATSYDADGNVLNQVQESYDGLGNITSDAQSHSGAVSGSTPSVNYSYSQSTGELQSMQYPNGRTLDYNYDSGIDSSIGRLSSISDSSGTLASYTYLGLDTPISTTYGNGVSQTITLNNLGEVAEEKWTNSSGTAIDDISYGYDNDGNVLYEQNNVLPSQSQLFTYDGLNRLTSYNQGTLTFSDGTPTISGSSATETWQLDALGNWKSSTADGTTTTRTNNAQNEATTVGTATLGYDSNGNTTTDQNGQQYVYDAWNRLVTVKNASGQTIASYSYDALGRRITETENGTTADLYYSTSWQVVEERQGGSTTTQYVWSPFYVDQLIERDDQPNGSGTLTRRLYAEQDADYNVTSITDSNGNVVERYSYDPYGDVTVENGDGTTKGDGSASASGYGWNVLHQGLMLDSVTGTYNDRNREYDPTLGRFLQQDPAGYVDGIDNYMLELNSPVLYSDPQGLSAMPTPEPPYMWPAPASEEAMEEAALDASALLEGLIAGQVISAAIDRGSGLASDCAYDDFNKPLPGPRIPYTGPINPQNGDPLVPPPTPTPSPQPMPDGQRAEPGGPTIKPQKPIFYVYFHRTPRIAIHDLAAILEGQPNNLNYLGDSNGAKQNRRDALKGSLRPPNGWSRDEYPFASTQQGGTGASVWRVRDWEQNYQRDDLNEFYRQHGYEPGFAFTVVVEP